MTSTYEETTAVTGPGSSPTRLLRRVFGDIASLVYLALCAGLTLWAFTAGGGEDASFAGVFPLLATAPVSLLLIVVPVEHPAIFALAVALGALANAALIGVCSRALRRRGGAAR